MNIRLSNPIHFFATGFGSGLLKPAPGTWGSLVGLLFAIFLWELTTCKAVFAVLTATAFAFGCYCCEKVSHDLGKHDDGRIVWDEMVAIWLIFVFLPEYSGLYYALTFLFFRLFDIWKPQPIRYFDERLEGGFGIMFDDILAAVYTLLALYLISWSL